MNAKPPPPLKPSPHIDPRNIRHGHRIPAQNYCDQPYVVCAADGAWVCVLTTGVGHEGDPGQTIAAMRSTDEGRTWSDPVYLEPADGPESSYAVALCTPSGRIYTFYNHNTDRIREILREDGGVFTRVDSLGHYAFKYSDDHGRTWSAQRYEVSVRAFAIDHRNIYHGAIRFFWNVGRPIISAIDGSVYLPHSKVGAMGPGFYSQSEGVFLRSPNLLTECDPARIHWETLPDGDIGLRPPPPSSALPDPGRIAEEHTIVELSDGTLYTIYRTVGGYPACSYSRDRGRTWDAPTPACYYPTAGFGHPRPIKHARAANFCWKTNNPPNRYLYWFHNHGGPAKTHLGPDWFAGEAYHGRNPAWLCAGREIDTPCGKAIAWSQPEILLYDDDPVTRISYPDLIESDDGRFWVTETQKTIARVHEIPARLLTALFNQHELAAHASDGLLYHSNDYETASGQITGFPRFPEFRVRHLERHNAAEDLLAGLTLDFTLNLASIIPTDTPTLLDTRASTGQGLHLTFNTTDRTLAFEMADGLQRVSWTSDPLRHVPSTHISIIVDGGPHLILFVVDGQLQDGGSSRQFGWGRFSPTLLHCNGAATARVSPALTGLRVYARALLVSEAVGNARAATGREAISTPA
ncbi:BNR/Asp-box repeat protein [Opitutaceae bacterium TAV1]|nr:BNR/Asp-box repeat protein [Opitutaceae bacterium TAV1]